MAVAILGLCVAAYFLYKHFIAPPPKMNSTESARPAGPGSGPGGGRGGQTLPVSVHVVEYGVVVYGESYMGTLRANEVVDISSQTSGKVVEILFEEGQWVEKGQLLLKIDDLDLQAQLKRAEHQSTLAAEKLERQRILFARDAVSRQAFDQAQTDHNMIMADIELLKVRIDRTEVRAPFSGVLGFRDIGVGSFLQMGATITRLVDVATLKLEFSIPEKNVMQLQDNMLARFYVQGSDKAFTAKVYAIDPVVDGVTLSFVIRARYDNRDRKLRSGMSASYVSVFSENAAEVLLAPSEGVVPDVDGRIVWLVRNGRAVSVPVNTGNRSSNMVEILGGLSAGDSVITSGLLQIRQGLPVQAVEF